MATDMTASQKNITSATLQKSVISSKPCLFSGLIATNQNASTRWLQVFDGYALPSGGDVPILELQVAGHFQGSIDLGVFNYIQTSIGLVVAASSSSGTYTDSGAADFFCSIIWN